jgi:hypothetical protein
VLQCLFLAHLDIISAPQHLVAIGGIADIDQAAPIKLGFMGTRPKLPEADPIRAIWLSSKGLRKI